MPKLPITGVNVLRLLRDGVAHDEFELRQLFKAGSRGAMEVGRIIDLLVNMGFVVSEDPASYGSRLTVTQSWKTTQEALGISLTELANYGETSIVANPFFGRPEDKLEVSDIFVLMAFQPELRPVYDDHIVSVANAMALSVKRADDFFGTRAVMGDIWEAIRKAKVIVADCTGRNPNVFYEIGLAHVVGTPVVLITQNSEDVPFDLRAIRYIQYQYTPRGMQKFEEVLTDTLKAVLMLPGASMEAIHANDPRRLHSS
jgi:hypothetical protein